MNFKKKIDHKDINVFLPDNLTIGTTEYFDNKFKGMMPDYICEILELKSREEYSNEKHNEEMLNIIKEKARQENLKIIKEYEEIVKRSEEEDEKDTENLVCCLDELDIKENISSER